MISFHLGHSQSQEKKLITFDVKNHSYEEIISKISGLSSVVFIYSSDFLPLEKINLIVKEETLKQVLSRLFKNTSIAFKIKNNEVILKPKNKILENNKQDKFTISGSIKDASTIEEIIGVNIVIDQKPIGTISNHYGFYSLTLPSGNYKLSYSAIGYNTVFQEINLNSDTTVNLQLTNSTKQLDEIEVISEKDNDYNKTVMSSFVLNSDFLNNTPAFLGENDLMRVLQMLPGVQSGNGVNTGLFIRGGGGDQNLILIDETPVYNASHLLGFFSVFNSDITKEAQLFKGSIPAKYGGRISSVLDIKTKDGNKKEAQLTGGIGSLSSKLTYQTPIKNGNGSLIVSGRRTYIDLLLQAIPDQNISANKLFFYDINLKANYRFDAKNHVAISGYIGSDKTGFEDVLGTTWGNKLGSVRWNHIFNPRLFSNATAYITNFRTKSSVQLADNLGYETRYNLWDIGLKNDYTYFIDPETTLDFGASLIHHSYLFGEINPIDDNSVVEPSRANPVNALESAVYINLEKKFSEKFSINSGLRFSRFDNVGSGNVFIYDTEDVISPETTVNNIVDTVSYDNFSFYNHYQGFEPRLTLSYNFAKNNSIKLSYTRTMQYLHQLSNSNTPSPLDMWAPVNKYIKPQIADQIAVGYFLFFDKSNIESSIEFYYKDLQNQIDFKPLANLFLNEHLETDILSGSGRAYGMEFIIKKQKGKSTGWISYNLSRAERNIIGINNDNPYPTSFDRLHDISIVFSHKLNKNLNISFDWVYSSGIAYSFPVGKYVKDGFAVPYYIGRNNFRLPATHHLDFSITFYRKQTKNQKNESSFNFSIYNMYLRKNAIGYVFRQKSGESNSEDNFQTEAVKLYFPIFIPSFSYNFKF